MNLRPLLLILAATCLLAERTVSRWLASWQWLDLDVTPDGKVGIGPVAAVGKMPPHPPRSGMLDLSGLPLKMDPAEVAERMGLPLDRCLGERGKGRGGR